MAKKYFIVIFTIIIIATGAAAYMLSLPASEQTEELKRLKDERARELQAANPELYQNLIKAVEEGERLSRETPGELEVWTELGANYQALADYASAKAAYLKALEINVNSQLAWNNLAKVYEKLGQTDEAEAAYRNLIQLLPGDPAAYNDLADLYERLGRRDEAGFVRGQYELFMSSRPSPTSTLEVKP